MRRGRWPTYRDLSRAVLAAGGVPAPASRGKGSHKLFKLGGHSIAVPWKYPNRDSTRTVASNVLRFIQAHGR